MGGLERPAEYSSIWHLLLTIGCLLLIINGGLTLVNEAGSANARCWFRGVWFDFLGLVFWNAKPMKTFVGSMSRVYSWLKTQEAKVNDGDF